MAAKGTFVVDAWLDFLDETKDDFDVFVVSETHRDEKQVANWKAKLAALGWHSHWSPAQSTGRGGTSGGTAVVARLAVQSSHLFGQGGTRDCDVGSLPFQDATFVLLSFSGFSFLFVSLYLTCGEGLEGPNNAKKLVDLTGLLSMAGFPWLVIGDFNTAPAEVNKSHWFQYVSRMVVVPDGGSVICTSGGGALLDFAVASCDLRLL